MVSALDSSRRCLSASYFWYLIVLLCLQAICTNGWLSGDSDARAAGQTPFSIDKTGTDKISYEGPATEGLATHEPTSPEAQFDLHHEIGAPYDDTLPNPLEELHHALETMQDHYFALWLGTWPTTIDWTAAVMGTHVSASLFSLSRSLEYNFPGTLSETAEGERIENEIDKYFAQTVAYYFGENAFSIRTQAYDDMLWVVLGWLENIKFMSLHNSLHYPTTRESAGEGVWHGKQFESAFAHRARVFYDLASKGWDTKLCGGGMLWNPHLTPYKNAITNELFISASVDMYLYFPGDKNMSPFVSESDSSESETNARPHDPKYLQAAIAGYAWLRSSNMTNTQGLYADGFHIRGYGRNGSIGTGQCDARNEMVYTYNQGVILSGLRGLWEGTGQREYLEDGHELIRNVIAATGWVDGKPNRSWRWSGLGRNGVLEEICDSSGTCSQNGQTFKGIFFHHLTLFCEPLPLVPRIPGKTHGASRVVAMLHAQSCKEYTTWVAHNARAALRTRDAKGNFGMWWGRSAQGEVTTPRPAPLLQGAIDYRNQDPLPGRDWMKGNGPWDNDGALPSDAELVDQLAEQDDVMMHPHAQDWNSRGRGRTVETQGGGVAVLRALWELVNMYE